MFDDKYAKRISVYDFELIKGATVPAASLFLRVSFLFIAKRFYVDNEISISIFGDRYIPGSEIRAEIKWRYIIKDNLNIKDANYRSIS